MYRGRQFLDRAGTVLAAPSGQGAGSAGGDGLAPSAHSSTNGPLEPRMRGMLGPSPSGCSSPASPSARCSRALKNCWLLAAPGPGERTLGVGVPARHRSVPTPGLPALASLAEHLPALGTTWVPNEWVLCPITVWQVWVRGCFYKPSQAPGPAAKCVQLTREAWAACRILPQGTAMLQNRCPGPNVVSKAGNARWQ